jgi:hypothetical protein
MKLLILGVLAIVMLAVVGGAAGTRDSNSYWRWKDEVRERAREARERAREARNAAREQAREIRNAQRQEEHALHEAAHESAARLREKIRREIRDWGYTY